MEESIQHLIERLQGSTTWSPRSPTIASPPEGNKHSAAKPPLWHSLSRQDPRAGITLKVAYRGGSNLWYCVHARGGEGWFTGMTCLHDVVAEITRSR